MPLTIAPGPDESAASYFGWAGFAWPTSRWAAATLIVPRLGPPAGQVAFWAGLGVGQPGIQQCGIACAWDGSDASYTAWYQMYPEPAVAFGGEIRAGDNLRMSVVRSGATEYILRVTNNTRKWSDIVTKTYAHESGQGEVIAEAFGPLPCGFEPARFTQVAGPLDSEYNWPFGGERLTVEGPYAFTVTRT